MPRRRRSSAAQGVLGGEAGDPQTERVAVFERTKMCKFHILGVCAKGSGCRFAHDKAELQHLPDLARTKLCKALINTGQCDNPECTYAHNKEELRAPPMPDAQPRRSIKPNQQQMQASPGWYPPSQQQQQQQQQKQQLQHQQQKQNSVNQMLQQPYMAPDGAIPAPNFDVLLQHMGQAAQAHVLEAARLQAMALQMHTGGEASPLASMGGDAGLVSYLSPTAGPAFPQEADPIPNPLPVPSKSPMLVAHSDPDGKSNSPLGSPVRDTSQQTLASAMSRMLGSEPVTIRTENLRSMSSNSLCRMAMDEEGEEENQEMPDFSLKNTNEVNLQDGAELALDRRLQALGLSDALDTGAITVKNTFLDFAPPTSALRSVRTAGGRLDLLGRRPSAECFDTLDE